VGQFLPGVMGQLYPGGDIIAITGLSPTINTIKDIISNNIESFLSIKITLPLNF
jgi:hypothetical protein